MTKAEYRDECTRVRVLCQLLAQEIRSFCPTGEATRCLERDAVVIGRRFAGLAADRTFGRRLPTTSTKRGTKRL